MMQNMHINNAMHIQMVSQLGTANRCGYPQKTVLNTNYLGQQKGPLGQGHINMYGWPTTNYQIPSHPILSHQTPSYQVSSYQIPNLQILTRQIPGHPLHGYRIPGHQIPSHQLPSHPYSIPPTRPYSY